jgi:diacylglycerol kinase (ATP)
MTPTNPTKETHKRLRGLRGLLNALGISWAGFRHAMVNDAAVRQEIIALGILVPISAWLRITDVEHLILVLSMMLVVLVEFVNSAIESTVDRISFERHPLAGQAKDKASTAVAIAVLMCGLSWVVIVGPIVVRWIRG